MKFISHKVLPAFFFAVFPTRNVEMLELKIKEIKEKYENKNIGLNLHLLLANTSKDEELVQI